MLAEDYRGCLISLRPDGKDWLTVQCPTLDRALRAKLEAAKGPSDLDGFRALRFNPPIIAA